ncbi:carboxylesterase family protein [Falsarthrobacter nasiphocae]|uniref:Carboxylic ester hydrolase n=1 Tax=Falsarthrobacter nasiphocae TaxID=189863 RepID=A0AAE3YCS6_9MICC|nr:carboxylesterase family protein [Falsarthrobacter nasiphocae]MDR6891513.1 para-nitrobenzyl esterase [Falsarthrobacter nasiphocae]
MTSQPVIEHRWSAPAGEIIGRVEGEVMRATGIPYATAGRFEKPRPIPPADEPIRAMDPAPACPQVPMDMLEKLLWEPESGLEEDENCLNLSVTLPKDASPGDGLPVMVWIHGGSYTAGAGDAHVFGTAPLASEQNVVVVSVTYRLSVLGYLGWDGGRPANLGLLDQIAALRWIQANIAAFGGDPENVTVFGQSAGADAVAHLMIARGASGLFRRGIIQSAPLGITRGRARMNALMAREAAKIPDDAPLAEHVGCEERVARWALPFGLKGAMPFGVQYGFDPLPEENELDEAWARAAQDIEILIGHTSREAALFTGEVPGMHAFVSHLALGERLGEGLIASLTRKIYADPAHAFARRHAAAGGRGRHYVISWGPEGSPYRAAHTIELPLLLGTREGWEKAALIAGAPWETIEPQGMMLRSLWGRFAREGSEGLEDYEGLIEFAPLDAPAD